MVYGPTAWHYLEAWEKFRTLGSSLDLQNQNPYFVPMFLYTHQRLRSSALTNISTFTLLAWTSQNICIVVIILPTYRWCHWASERWCDLLITRNRRDCVSKPSISSVSFSVRTVGMEGSRLVPSNVSTTLSSSAAFKWNKITALHCWKHELGM